MNCYQCKHRGNVPGSAHSSCQHPAVEDKKFELAVLFAVAPDAFSDTVIANRHGIDKGWFVWPLDFDPTWLGRCTIGEQECSIKFYCPWF